MLDGNMSRMWPANSCITPALLQRLMMSFVIHVEYCPGPNIRCRAADSSSKSQGHWQIVNISSKHSLFLSLSVGVVYMLKGLLATISFFSGQNTSGDISTEICTALAEHVQANCLICKLIPDAFLFCKLM